MANYVAKRQLTRFVDEAKDALCIDTDDSVTINGFYGEKGVLFFPNEDADCPPGTVDPEAALGFTMLGTGIPAKHYNLSRPQAAALFELLGNAYGFEVVTEDVPVTVYETRFRVTN